MSQPTTHASHSNYLQSGFSHTIGWGDRPALLLIDVCNAYWTDGSPLDISSNPAAKAVPKVIGRLVEAAREGGVPVFWTRVLYEEKEMGDAGIFVKKAPLLKVFQVGNKSENGVDLGGWVKGLEPKEGEIVLTKKYPSAFFATDLNTRLQIKGVDTLVVCGVSTSGCVRASTLDAMCFGYRPMVCFSYSSGWLRMGIVTNSMTRSLLKRVGIGHPRSMRRMFLI